MCPARAVRTESASGRRESNVSNSHDTLIGYSPSLFFSPQLHTRLTTLFAKVDRKSVDVGQKKNHGNRTASVGKFSSQAPTAHYTHQA